MADVPQAAEQQLDLRIKELNKLPDSDPEKYAQLSEAYKLLDDLHGVRRQAYLEQVREGRAVPIADPAHPRYSEEAENTRQVTQIARADAADEGRSPAERQEAISDIVTPDQEPDEASTPEADTTESPSLDQFLARAIPDNPSYTKEELTRFWEKTYGPKEPAARPHLPTLEEWLPQAKKDNPDYNEGELTDYWKDLYGSRGAKERDPGVFDTLVEGAKGTARNLKAFGQTLTGNKEGVVETAQDAARGERAQALDDFLQGVGARKQAAGPDASIFELAKALGAETLNNPKGAALLGVEQAPNTAAMMGMAGAGALAGFGLFGPPGALIGGIAGLFLGNTSIETGSKAIEKAADQEFTDTDREDTIRQGLIKGTVISGIDLVTFGATKWLTGTATRATEAATARVLTEEGINIADRAAVQAAAKNPQIRTKVAEAQQKAAQGVNTLAKRAMRGGAEVGLESLGEGVGEYVGEEAATGQGDKMEALIEAFTGLGQSAAEIGVAGAMSRRETADAAKFEPDPTDVAGKVMGGTSVDDTIKKAQDEVDKPVTPDDLDAAIRRQRGEEPPGPPPPGGSTPPVTPPPAGGVPPVPSIEDVKEAYTDSHYAADKAALDHLLSTSDKAFRGKNGDWYVRRRDGSSVRMDVVRPDSLPDEEQDYGQPRIKTRTRNGRVTMYSDAATKPISKSQYEALRVALGAQGKRLVLFTPNSRFDGVVWGSQFPNIVFMASETSVDPVSVAFHEAAHLMQGTPLYDVFQEVVRENLKPEAKALAIKRHDIKPSDFRGEERLHNEISADIAGDAMTRPDFMQKVFERLQERLGEQKAHTLAQQFLDTLKTLMNRILDAATGKRFRTKDGRMLVDRYVNNLEKVHEALSHAVAEQYYKQGKVQTSTEQAPGVETSDVIRSKEERMILHPEVAKVFHETAEAQRGAPEQAMLKVHKAFGGGVLNPVVEHAGDLVHTMTHLAHHGTALQPVVREKVDRVLKYLTHPYGFEKELANNIRQNSEYYKTTPAQLQLKVNEALNEYANEHAKLKVYNLPQWLGKQAAVAIGKREYQKATTYLTQLKAIADSNEFTKMAFAHERNELGKLKEFLRPISAALIGVTPNGRTLIRESDKQAYHLLEDVDHLPKGTKATQEELNALGYKAVPHDLISHEDHQERVKKIEGKETKAEKLAREEKEKSKAKEEDAKKELVTKREDAVEESSTESDETEIPAHAPAFYSHMIKTLEAKMPNKASADQIRAILSPKNGVKPEEMKWTGMEKFLSTKGMFTKDEVLDFASHNRLVLKEIMLGNPPRDLSELDQQIRAISFWPQDATRARNPEDQIRLDALNEEWEKIGAQERNAGVKYDQGDLNLPGGEDYRELLFQLPPKNVPTNWTTAINKAETEHTGKEMRDVLDATGRVRATLPAEEVAKYLRREADIAEQGTMFTGGHWDQPNILAHTRFNTRMINGKKTLFIEEIQSDWHQKGRKEGYKVQNPSPEDAKQFFGISNETWNRLTDEQKRSYVEEMTSGEKHVQHGVPDAPFRKTWQEYVLRRMIRYAAEHGYDQVAWTTGEQQAERYDLSKRVESVEYGDGYLRVKTYAERGGTRDYINESNVTPERLVDYIGKEAAEKLLNSPKVKIGQIGDEILYKQYLKGDDLQVGGEGMKGFYDKILVDYANKLGKPFGAKVEDASVPNPDKQYRGLKISSDGVNYWVSTKEGEPIGKRYGSYIEADDRRAELMRGSEPVHALPITNAMKQSVLTEGQPTFSTIADEEEEEPVSQAPSPDRSYNPYAVEQPGKLDYIIRKLQDRTIDIKRIVEAIKKAGNVIPDSLNAIFKEEMYQKRAQQRSEDYTNQELKPLLDRMRLAGVGQDELDKYLHAKHVLEDDVNARLKDLNPTMPDNEALSGMSDEEARKIMSSYSVERMQVMDQLAARVQAMVEKTRDLMVDYGLESENRIAQWRYLYRFYVPLRREEYDEAGNPSGTGRSVRGSTASPRLGSNLGVSPILANVAQARDQIITRGEKMRPVVAMAGLLMMYPNEEIASLDKPAEIETIDPQTGLPMIVPGDLASYKVPMIRRLDPRTGEARMFPDPLYKGRDNVVNFRIKGIDYAIVFNEKNERALEAAKAFKELDSGKLNAVMQAIAPWTRYLASINTQYNPIFGIVNFVRDAQFASLALASTPLAGKQMQILNNARKSLAGIFQDARDARHGLPPSSATAQLWERFQHVGGPTGYRDLFFTARDRHTEIERLLNPNTWRHIRSPQDLGRRLEDTGLFRLLSDYNLTMENAIRLGVFKTGIEMGLSDLEAASHAKNITVNFNKRGQIGAQMGSLYAFFNANVQGTARILETLFERTPDGGVRLTSGGKKIIAGGLLLGVLQTAMLALGGFGDDEPPEYIKSRNLVFPAPGTDKGYTTIPMPLGFNLLPNVGRLASEAVWNGISGRSPQVMKKGFDLLYAAIGTLSPTGGSGSITQEVMPTVLDPVASLEANKDWTGKSISKEDISSLKPTPGHTRAHDTATPWAMALSKAINWATGGSDYTPGVLSPTPDAIDFVIEQATGGVGRELSKTAQVAKSAVTGEELPFYKVPLVGRFVGSSTGSAAIRSRFYDNIKAANIAMEEIKGRALHKEELQSYLKTHPEARFAQAADHFQRGIGDLQKAKQEAIKKGDREKVRMFEDRITGLMKRFNDAVDEARKLR